MQPCRSLSRSKPRQDDQHGVHPVKIDERKCVVLCGAVKNLCLASKDRTHRLNMEIDLQILFGLLCKAVLIG
jgi:hypothetical protein